MIQVSDSPLVVYALGRYRLVGNKVSLSHSLTLSLSHSLTLSLDLSLSLCLSLSHSVCLVLVLPPFVIHLLPKGHPPFAAGAVDSLRHHC